MKVRNSSLVKKIHTGEKPLEVLPEDDHITSSPDKSDIPVTSGDSVPDIISTDNASTSSSLPVPCPINSRPKRERKKPDWFTVKH